MIFDRETTKLILSGRKTMVRRRVRGGELRPGNIQPGRSYPLERPAKDSEIREDRLKLVLAGRLQRPHVEVAQLLIDAAPRRERHGDISPVDAYAEGHRTTGDHKRAWVRRYDRRWLSLRPTPDDPDLLLARFDRVHADQEVWVVTFRLDSVAPPLLLAAQSEVGYVHRAVERGRVVAIADAGEAVDPEMIAVLNDRRDRNQKQSVTAEWLERREKIEEMIAGFLDGHDLTASDVKFLRKLRHQLDLGDRRFVA